MSKFHAIYGKGGVSPEPGGNIYGEVQTLLWTNDSPTSPFPRKTISLDLTDYDGVIVEYAPNITETTKIISRVKCAKSSNNIGSGNITTLGIARFIHTVDDNGVVFGDCYASTVDNNNLIPIKIYGYKQYETGRITGEAGSVSFSTNTDLQLDKNSYYLITVVNSTAIVASKGNIITKIDSTTVPSSDYYGQSVIVFTGESGIVNFNMAGKAKKISVGD